MTNEVKLFSELRSQSPFMSPALKAGSVSAEDMKNREAVYEKVFSTYHELKDEARKFSGYTENVLLTNQFFNATVMAYVSSFAGFLSIERAMDAATALVSWLDVIGVSDGRSVMPNIGAEDLSGVDNKAVLPVSLTTGTADYDANLAKKLIPGSVVIILSKAGNPDIEIKDDGQGGLIAKPGILAAGTVNYLTGLVEFECGTGFVPATGDTATVVGVEDQPGVTSGDGTNIFTDKLVQKLIGTYPELMIAQTNLASIAAMKKSVSIDPSAFMIQKLTEMFTKMINKKQVGAINNGYKGQSFEIDLSKASLGYDDYRAYLDAFSGGLTDVDGALAEKSVKGINATSYVVGRKVADWMKKTKTIGLFTEATGINYINDLVGYYNGIPVLRHTDLNELTGYAVHKTADGNMAPLCRAIFLPLTSTPTIGNYNNPTQQATGVYYQEKSEVISTELVQKFTLKLQ